MTLYIFIMLFAFSYVTGIMVAYCYLAVMNSEGIWLHIAAIFYPITVVVVLIAAAIGGLIQSWGEYNEPPT